MKIEIPFFATIGISMICGAPLMAIVSLSMWSWKPLLIWLLILGISLLAHKAFES